MIDFYQSGETRNTADIGTLYIKNSPYADLQSELNSNVNIVDTLGGLPGPSNFNYKCSQAHCIFEINCELNNNTYYFAVTGGQSVINTYNFTVTLRSLNVTALQDRQPVTLLGDSIRTVLNELGYTNPIGPSYPDHSNYYRFFSFNVPLSRYSEGTYLIVNISRALPANKIGALNLFYGALPFPVADKNLVNSATPKTDTPCIYPRCVDTRLTSSETPYQTHPVRSQPRVPCSCTPYAQNLNDGFGSYQLTCNVTVDPCAFQYGTWYIGVQLPQSNSLFNTTIDYANQFNYTIGALVVQPTVVSLFRNVTFKGFAEPEAASHYKVVVPTSSVIQGSTHLMVQVSNVRGGTVDIFVHSNQGIGAELSGREGCVPANVTCRTSDACNLVIEKCHFSAGTWYITVEIVYDTPTPPTDPSTRYQNFRVPDIDRLPVTYTIRANWLEDPTPQVVLAGVPVFSAIGASLYDFYVVNVPATIDTWLFIELYTNVIDTEVILSVLHGALPGGDCYARPDFYCLTGDPRHLQIPTGNPRNLVVTPQQREACSFMIQTCELQAGPLYLSVYGHHTGYQAYPLTPDTTYYQIPAQYTLWVDFDVPLAISSGVSYSENVFEKQYQHYYIRADNVNEGSSMVVEATNILHGVPQSLEVFVNYNYLAGNCPCYDHLFNCTGATEPSCGNVVPPANPNSFIPQPGTVASSCAILVPPCAFRSGVWYIAVLGVNEDRVDYTTPIGYTLTVTINDAPTVKPLLLGQAVVDQALQWNQTNVYNHFKLAAEPVPLHDLVLKLVYVQSTEYLPKHDNLGDVLTLYVNSGSLATAECQTYTCNARISTSSFCVVVVPHCQWVGDNWFVSVQGNFNAVFPGRFTLRASVEEVRDTQLVDGVSVYGRAPAYRYQHYFLDVPAEGKRYLQVNVYTNADQDAVSAYLNVDQRAGSNCFTALQSCVANNFCSFQIEGCQLQPARYHVSVYGVGPQFYDISVEYTLVASLVPTTYVLSEGDPVTGSVLAGQTQHYQFAVANAPVGSFLLFEIDNVKNGQVATYINYNGLAGRCSACATYGHLDACVANSAGTVWCELRVPPCLLQNGTYYFSVVGLTSQAPAVLGHITPIGYTIEVNVVNPDIQAPLVQVDRQPANTLTFQYIANNRYKHYAFTIQNTDFTSGFQVIVEISNIREGALFAYYNPNVPGDQYTTCNVARICQTANMGAGGSCSWQLPYCLTRPGLHYISIEGITGRLQASFDILIWLQRPAQVVANPLFVGLSSQITNSITATNEITVTHVNTNQPNGWVQFIRLQGVTTSDPQGDILELFFYRINNNPGDPTDFEVYVNPSTPAGPHTCCPTNVGGCQGFPCLNNVPSTSRMLGDAYSSEFRPNRYLCGGNPAATYATSPTGFEGLRCNVTVWGCNLAAAQSANTPVDWWVTVIPVGVAANPGQIGAKYRGLTYSMEWRVRNVRTDVNGNAASTTSLTSTINTVANSTNVPVPTQFFTIGQYETFRSFSFDVSVPAGTRKRLVVQTEFGTGTPANAVAVYIRKGAFANPDTCNDPYVCPHPLVPTDSCACQGRYISNSCCTSSATYYITVRDLLNAPGNVTFRFTITLLTEGSLITINASPSPGAPYRYTGSVQGESYQHFVLPISASDVSARTSLIVILQKTDTTDGSPLDAYVFAGGLAGRDSRVADNVLPPESNLPQDNCFFNQYTCQAVGPLVAASNSNSGRCVIQVPQCQLNPDQWYISVYTESFYPAAGPTSPSCPRYVLGRNFNLTVYLDSPPAVLTLGNTFIVSPTRPVGLVPQVGTTTYTHYTFTVAAADIAFDPKDNTQGYYTRFLRVELANITLGSGTVYLNYDDLAGNSNDQYCLDYYASTQCSPTPVGAPCYIDVLPCNGLGVGDSTLKLVPGNYFVSTAFAPVAAYSIRARILTNTYTVLTGAVVAGTGHRTGTNNVFYTVTPSVTTRTGTNEFRYVVDTKTEAALFNGRDYLIANLTVGSNDPAPAVSLTMWRDDCNVWSCNVNTVNGSCVIDAVELATCTAQRGRYYFKVVSPNAFGSNNVAIGFTLSFYHNNTIVNPLLNNQVVTEIVYPHEYQQYYYVPANVGPGSVMSVVITAACGDVEAWILNNANAGPSHSSTQSLGTQPCSIDYCRTSNGIAQRDVTSSSSTCTLYLDTCQITDTQAWWITIRGVTTSFPNVANANLYTPIKYSIQVQQHAIAYSEVHLRTTAVVSYAASPVQAPSQFVYRLETVVPGTFLRFSLRTPTSFVAATAFSRLWVNLNAPVAYSSDCSTNSGSCTVGTDGTCSITISSCGVGINPSTWYVVADAPRGSEVLVERWDPVVAVLTPFETYTSTINAVSDTPNWQLPYVTPYQYYRIDTDPTQATWSLRVRVFNVAQGSLSVVVNAASTSFFGPLANPSNPYCPATAYVNTQCQSVDANNVCDVRVSQCDVSLTTNGVTKYLASTFFITVAGVQQTCALHSIQYSILVTDVETVARLPINSPTCGVVTPQTYTFYRLSPREVETPQTSVLRITVDDVGITQPQEVFLSVRDKGLPTVTIDPLGNAGLTSTSCNTVATRSQFDVGSGYVDYICGYSELYLSVYGIRDAISIGTSPINYRITATKTPVPVTVLADNTPLIFDDTTAIFTDDGQNCPTRTFFRFPAQASNDAASYLYVEVFSDASNTGLQLYLNKDSFAAAQCASSSCTTPYNGYCWVSDFCSYSSTNYYITVYSGEAFTINARVRQDVTPLTLGAAKVSAQIGDFLLSTFSVVVPANPAPDARLIFELTDAYHGALYAAANFGRVADPDGTCGITYGETISFSYQASSSGVVVSSCQLQAGTYYLTVSTYSDPGHCPAISFAVRAYLDSYGIKPTELTVNAPALTGQIVSGDLAAFADPTETATFIRYYHVAALQQNGRAFSQIVVSSVQGGNVFLYVKKGRLAVPSYGYFPGSREWLWDNLDYGSRPNTLQYFFANGFSGSCADYGTVSNSQTGSASVWVDSCTWAFGDFYVAVGLSQAQDDARTVYTQSYFNNPVTFNIAATEYADWHALGHDEEVSDTFVPSAGVQSRYYSIFTGTKSLVWRTAVTANDSVTIDIYNSPCASTATYRRSLLCRSSAPTGLCDIEIPTAASHPGLSATTTFYVVITGSNATFHSRAYVGRENCHDFVDGGRPDKLQFCAALLPYSVWRWSDYTRLDDEAAGFFTELYDHFRVQPCWSGVTPECNATLQRFACYESFHRCDSNGFQVGTCRKACEAVAYECVNWFESVGLEHYNCSSSRYLDDSSQQCTGHLENTLEFNNNPFLNEVDNILFQEPAYIVPSSVNAAAPMSASFALLALVVVSVLFSLF